MNERFVNSPKHRASRQVGVGLIEVLVSLLVLSIGLLGLAALQAQSLRFTTDAYLRSQATVLASDIIDRIRANRDNVAAYVAADLKDLHGDRDDCDATLATVDNDLKCWLLDVDDALGGALPTLAANGTNASFVDVTMTWIDREPREYSGESSPRLPEDDEECLYPDGDTSATKLENRSWNEDVGDDGACLVTQTWTVLP